MVSRPIRLTLIFSISIIFAFTAQTMGISISTSSSAAGETASSWESFNLDDSASLQERMVLASGGIFMNRQAEGRGNNSLKQTLSSGRYVLHNDIESQGEFAAFTASSSSAQSANLDQNVEGAGSLSLQLQGKEGSTDAVQQANVEGGILSSQQSLSAGEGITSSQSTLIEGQEGSVLSGALGKDNVMVARGSFEGRGILKADLDSSTLGRASTDGSAFIDGESVLNEETFETLSVNEKTMGMGMSGLRMVEGGLGNFDVSVLDINFDEQSGISYASNVDDGDAIDSKGSASSYALTGFRWNQKDPNIQLYLNPTDTPPGIKVESARDAITAAANTWDGTVGQNLFVDGSTVLIDSDKKVIDPFSASYLPDGFNVNGFLNLNNKYLAVTTFWTDLTKKDDYYSLIESDIVYNLDFKWTDDEKQARNTGKLDLQSVALHELGHTIGLEDLYILKDGDERKKDLDQVMNLYNGPQRTLGNGDLAGVQRLYGSNYGEYLNGDFDGNGKSDLIQLSGNDYIKLMISNGDGTFDQHTFSPWFGYCTSTGKWVLGDLNGDGKTDLQHIKESDYINSWISKGDGTFDVKSFSPWQGYGIELGDWATADINGDGLDDLQHIWGGDYINTWISKGDGTYQVSPFQPWTGYATSIGNWETGDVNGDGLDDLQHIWGGDYINTWISKGNANYQISSFQPWAGYATSLGDWVNGDVNGDGLDDLQHIWGGDYINTWISKGDGTYRIKSYSPSPEYNTTKGEWIRSDINGDKRDDLAYIAGEDHLDSWISQGDGTYLVSTYSPWAEYSMTAGKWQKGDVNGDGMNDLMHLADNDSVFIWFSKGDGAFNIVPYMPNPLISY